MYLYSTLFTTLIISLSVIKSDVYPQSQALPCKNFMTMIKRAPQSQRVPVTTYIKRPNYRHQVWADF